ncbi:DEAD/DEAH box helicase [Actinocorallia longicatena]|uniref:DEAD/DEAH box helicase n=1 Tax=Actinocorallia longicatena TaxID=111803 RepID=A0ABP6QCK7_9ACTN
MTLADLLPEDGDPDKAFEAFASWTLERGLTLYPAQEEALMELVTGANVILATPTGSGKSLVAAGAHFAALARDECSFYTAPIKALVSEKFFDLVEQFGSENVGMMTGDASVNPTAPIICCTAEVLSAIALQEGDRADIGLVVMDEFHFYAEPERGVAWQIPLLEMPQAQFLLMSATLGDVAMFETDLTRRTGRPTAVVRSATRPVPLEYAYKLTPLHETIEHLLMENKAPVYIVHFTQVAAIERAQSLMSVNVCSKEEKARIGALIGRFRFTTKFGKTLERLVRHGIGVHHAGMLPKYRRLVERLAQAGLLKIICGTDTLGVGVNVPIRTVLFTALSKYDGRRVRRLRAREFHQIAGRAGRAGFDTVGYVVCQAPDHIVENHKAVLKAGDDAKKLRKVVKKKPPEGFVSWDEETFTRLQTAEPESLLSRFEVSHHMLLAVINRPGNAFQAMKKLLTDNHEDRARQRAHISRAIAIYRSLKAGGIIEELTVPDEDGRWARITVDLQQDFALNQPLSTFALAALELLDKESVAYPLDVVSVIEATLDDPRQILAAQLNKIKGEAVFEMKMEGIEYEERMELLQEIDYEKPLEELLEGAFEIYTRGNPWVADHPLRPKTVVRDMFERAMTFAQYVQYYELARSEGIVLRYLAGAYKALSQTVPDAAKTEELQDLIEWLGELVRQVDSSLLDEWEQLANPADEPEKALEERTTAVTRNVRAFRVLVRNAMFRHVELAALRRYDLLADLDTGWSRDDWEDALLDYYDEHAEIRTDGDARGPKLLQITEEDGVWHARQTLHDPDGDHDWYLLADVDLAASDEAGTAVLHIAEFDRLD